jgi:hypothetical protein
LVQYLFSLDRGLLGDSVADPLLNRASEKEFILLKGPHDVLERMTLSLSNRESDRRRFLTSSSFFLAAILTAGFPAHF